MRLFKLSGRVPIVLLVLLGTASLAYTTEAQTCGVPLAITYYDSAMGLRVLRDLQDSELMITIGAKPVLVKQLSIDDGPRRVAVILDASGNVPDPEWDLEVEMATSFVGNGRAKDSFYFLLVGTDNSPQPLSAEEVIQRLGDLEESRPKKVEPGERVYDALLTAAKLFDPPRFGDTIFLFGHPEDHGSKVGIAPVRKLVQTNGIRFLALSFSAPSPFRGKPGGGLSELEDLSVSTGYFFSFTDLVSISQPGQKRLWKGFLTEQYATIAEPYRLGFSASPNKGLAEMKIDVSKLKERGIRIQDAHYPRMVYPCTAKTAGTDLPAAPAGASRRVSP